MSHLVYPTAAPLVWNPRMPGGMRDGLVFAGGMEFPGSTYYHDASGYGNNGTLTNMDPATDWVWSNWLGEWTVQLTRSGSAPYQYVLIPCALSSPYTISLWLYLDASQPSGFPTWIHSGNPIQYGHANTGKDFYASGKYFSARYTEVSTWMHLAYTSDGTNVSIYRDGVYRGQSAYAPAAVSEFKLGRSDSYGANGYIGRVAAHSRILPPGEIQWLADPTRHLRVPWRRTVWPVSAGPTFNPAWAARCNNLIGAGI